MRIAQIAPIPERVPPKKYGGTERVIYHLTEELVKRGHEVTLFASGDSLTSARLLSVVDRPLREMPDLKDIYGFNIYSLMNMGEAYSMHEAFDVIHDHNPHLSLPIAQICPTPTVMTWHGPYEGMAPYFELFPRPHLVSISRAQQAGVAQLNFAGTVYNGLPLETYPFLKLQKTTFLFVGRIDPEKGIHLAIDAAVRTGHRLIIAAKLDDTVAHLKRYYDEEIAPRLKKHASLVQWIGEVDEEKRNELMKHAKAFLHAVTWPEPFGLALIEAQACGSPVIAMNKGSIPEIIQNGKTGFVVNTLEEMVDAIGKVSTIRRADCREHVLEHFTAKQMTDGYEAIYEKILKKTEKK